MSVPRSAAALCAVLALAVAAAAQAPPQLEDPDPGQVYLTPQIDLGLVDVPLVVPEPFAGAVPADAVMRLPQGFTIKVFAASGLEGPRMMAFSPDGVLHVANMKVGGGQFTPAADTDTPPPADEMLAQIVALPDRDRDGVADEAVVVADRLWFPNSIQFYEDYLYVADMHQLVRLRDADGDGFYEERQVVVPDLPIGHHRTRTVLIDPQRQKLFLSIGSSCDMCRETDPRRATIMEYDLDGANGRVYSRGWRNAIGLALHPVSGQLWATNNGHDREGRDLPPERIDIVREDSFHGWPVAYGYQVWTDFSIQAYEDAIFPLTAQDSADVASMPRPVAQVPAHLAPMAIHFYTGVAFPGSYQNAAFVALRGGGNARGPGHKVVAVFAEPDGSGAQVADFLTGFVPAAGGGAWGKPVGLAEDAAGALYVTSDWIRHAVFKIVPSLLQGSDRSQVPPVAYTGDTVEMLLGLRLDGRDPDGQAPAASADLSAFGLDQAIELAPGEDGRYEALVRIPAGDEVGVKTVTLVLSQQTATDLNQLRFTQEVRVVRGEDLVVAADAFPADWQLQESGGAAVLAPDGSGPVFEGEAALPVRITDPSLLGWRVTLTAPQPLASGEYGALRLAVHTEQVVPGRIPRLAVQLRPGRSVDLVGEGLIDLERSGWQEVRVPIEQFELDGRPLEGLRIDGTVEGTFYLDDLRLETLFPRPATAVIETRQEAVPDGFELDQNFPNPFNSGTSIGFTLAEGAEVELAVYNLAGQKVATLVKGLRPVGAYRIDWDGRSDDGSELATGIYIYRLRTEAGVLAKKLLLLR